jgi:hypothetical protein
MLEHPAELTEYSSSWQEPVVRMWRESFEFGVGITDPHPLAEQVASFENEIRSKNTLRLAFTAGQLVGFVAASSESVAQLAPGSRALSRDVRRDEGVSPPSRSDGSAVDRCGRGLR